MATYQLALPESFRDTAYATTGYEQSVSNLANVTLGSHNVFSDDSSPTVTGDVGSGYALTPRVGVDTSTTPAARSASAGGGGGGGATSGDRRTSA